MDHYITHRIKNLWTFKNIYTISDINNPQQDKTAALDIAWGIKYPMNGIAIDLMILTLNYILFQGRKPGPQGQVRVIWLCRNCEQG